LNSPIGKASEPRLKFVTKDLSLATWPDFVKLFTQGNGWDHCFCVHFHRACSLPKSEWLPTRSARAVRNRRVHKKLLERNESHGILVYAEGQPVSWCQYGAAEELPRFDNSKSYRAAALDSAALGKKKLWRISCFVVHRHFRRCGIAGIALKGALRSIEKRGGGTVESFPLADLRGQSFGNASTGGTVSMFTKEGFAVVSRFGNFNVVMRREI
jgi:acetyltransferase (GNAT) family protein